MLIETWIAVMIIVFLFIGFFILAISGITNDQRLENERAKNDALREENEELKRYIAVQKTKSIITVANDFYNEEEKK